MNDYDDLLRENTRGLLFRDADNLSDWTVGTELQLRCDGCGKGVWAEDTSSEPRFSGEHICQDCAFQIIKEEAMAL